MINEISPELVGKVNKERLKKPSKTAVASKTLSKAVKKAWLKSKVGVVKEDKDDGFHLVRSGYWKHKNGSIHWESDRSDKKGVGTYRVMRDDSLSSRDPKKYKTLAAAKKALSEEANVSVNEDAPVPQSVKNIPGKASVLGQGSGVMRALDLFLVYQFLKRLLLPFDKWPAYQAGIIDADGKVLRKRNTLSGPERGVWGLFDVMTANIKKIIMKAPGGKTKLASALAAAYLLKEMKNFSEDRVDFFTEQFEQELHMALSEEIANNVGDGKIAGLGVGPQGEPGRSKKSLKIIKRTVRAK